MTTSGPCGWSASPGLISLLLFLCSFHRRKVAGWLAESRHRNSSGCSATTHVHTVSSLPSHGLARKGLLGTGQVMGRLYQKTMSGTEPGPGAWRMGEGRWGGYSKGGDAVTPRACSSAPWRVSQCLFLVLIFRGRAWQGGV